MTSIYIEVKIDKPADKIVKEEVYEVLEDLIYSGKLTWSTKISSFFKHRYRRNHYEIT